MTEVTTDVGNTKVYEDDKIVVWNFELQPGETTPMHKHERSYLWYVINGAPLDCKGENGEDLGVVPAETGAVFQLKVEGDTIEVMDGPGKGATMPATHTAKNLSDEVYREILIEFK